MGYRTWYVVPEELAETWIGYIHAAGFHVAPVETVADDERKVSSYRVESSDEHLIVIVMTPSNSGESTNTSSHIDVRFGISIYAKRSGIWPFGSIPEKLAMEVEQILLTNGAQPLEG